MPRILIIDDELHMLDVMKRMLNGFGYEVLEASDGNEGINLFREKPVDLVITDIVMPNKEGLETIKELKRDFPDVKIIAMSGGGRIGPDDYLKLASGLGADKILTKPIRRNEFLENIKELLGVKTDEDRASSDIHIAKLPAD